MKGMIGFVTLFTSGSQIIASKLGGPPVEFAAKLAAQCELMIKCLNSFHFNGHTLMAVAMLLVAKRNPQVSCLEGTKATLSMKGDRLQSTCR